MLTIKTGEANHVTVFALQGDLDAATFNMLIEETDRFIERGTTHLLLDMSEVGFISSAGLFALQSIVTLLKGEEPPNPEDGWAAHAVLDRDREGGLTPYLKLCCVNAQILTALERTGFTAYVGVHADKDEALAAFNS